jgi:peptide deformylase
MVGSKKIGEKIEDRAVEILDSRIQHEIDRLLGVK